METALSLSQLTAMVGTTIRRESALAGVWVVAELSDVRRSGGHCYMELVEKDERGATRAKMRAMIWASNYYGLSQKFVAVAGRDLGSGIKVMVRGNVTHHDVYGMAFQITDVDPSYTLGDRERLRREIIDRLRREGILDRNKSVPLAPNPQRIALISSATAAGYGDFINQLHSTDEPFAFYTHLFPSIMQGERTAAGIIGALDMVEQTIDLWDCVVIIRGGGGTTDLDGFDDYALARAVALFPLPVIVGIGHERDRTVLDEIAHTRCKTPTAVAEFLRDRLRTAYDRVARTAQWIRQYASDRLAGEKMRLANLQVLLPEASAARTSAARSRLNAVTDNLPSLIRHALHREEARISASANLLSAVARRQTDLHGAALQRTADRLKMAIPVRLNAERETLGKLDALVSVLSPDNTLRRGYSITRVDGRAVIDAAQLAPGDTVTTTLARGSFTSNVTNSSKTEQ